MVKFKKLDLFSQVNISHFDMQEKLFQRFHESLNDGGYLIIGKTEGIFSGARDKFDIINSRERIYQKK